MISICKRFHVYQFSSLGRLYTLHIRGLKALVCLAGTRGVPVLCAITLVAGIEQNDFRAIGNLLAEFGVHGDKARELKEKIAVFQII